MLSRFSCGFLPIAVVRQLQRGCGKLVSPKTYHEKVVEHYNNPRNVGSFDKDNPDVGTGLVGAPACGDVMKLQIRVDEKTGKIIDSCFKTFGCGSAIASSSVGVGRSLQPPNGSKGGQRRRYSPSRTAVDSRFDSDSSEFRKKAQRWSEKKKKKKKKKQN
ncbi:uncharacterized protein [Physcomitrium patens]|uniref:uncharacterized protein isoform X3 n=1 Tax=Physcomitrium patens TaxID=3218 RepID=UPI003CCD6220